MTSDSPTPAIDTPEWNVALIELVADHFPATFLLALVDSVSTLQAEIGSMDPTLTIHLADASGRLLRTASARSRLVQLLTSTEHPSDEGALQVALAVAQKRESSHYDPGIYFD